jgi:hypothetical protein
MNDRCDSTHAGISRAVRGFLLWQVPTHLLPSRFQPPCTPIDLQYRLDPTSPQPILPVRHPRISPTLFSRCAVPSPPPPPFARGLFPFRTLVAVAVLPFRFPFSATGEVPASSFRLPRTYFRPSLHVVCSLSFVRNRAGIYTS